MCKFLSYVLFLLIHSCLAIQAASNGTDEKERIIEEAIYHDIDEKGSIWDRSFGCVLGAAIGDSLGSFLEFKTDKKEISTKMKEAMQMPGGGPHGVAPGQVTDDTEMAISLARGIVNMLKKETPASYHSQYAADLYDDWLNDSDPFDRGNCTKTVLTRSRSTLQDKVKLYKYRAEKFNLDAAEKWQSEGNLANGALMRCMPLIVYGHRLPQDQLALLMAEDASLTHANAINYFASATYAIAIQSLINSKEGNRKKRMQQAFDEAVKWLDRYTSPAAKTVQAWLQPVKSEDTQAFEPAPTNKAGFVKIAFQRAFYHLLVGTSFRESLRSVVQEGGDTDTNCCIVGGMIGAASGYKALYEDKNCLDYCQKVLNVDVTKAQNDLANKSIRNHYQARHYEFLLSSIIHDAPTEITMINGKAIKDKSFESFLTNLAPQEDLSNDKKDDDPNNDKKDSNTLRNLIGCFILIILGAIGVSYLATSSPRQKNTKSSTPSRLEKKAKRKKS